jgi:hypothetical protein
LNIKEFIDELDALVSKARSTLAAEDLISALEDVKDELESEVEEETDDESEKDAD